MIKNREGMAKEPEYFHCLYCGQYFHENEGREEKEKLFIGGKFITLYHFICNECYGIRELNVGEEKR